ncbi:MAG: protein kinase [Verrucomicrobiales bacterium]|nr:protein kinase [Verrucomicrobiales bacterium]
MLAQETEQDPTAGSLPPLLAAGDTIGGMEILNPLARGGMGVVYKARQPKLNRVVAIKVIDATLAGVPEFTQRFEREARALAVLNHPNVVQVFDHGHEDGLCYLVMEWVDGASLREILTAGHLSADDALRYVPQICDALEYAHAQGVVHRDIKPENILIDRQGQLKIADFGIARLRGDEQTGQEFVTQAGQKMGTPQYMAPEQQKHTDRVDHRADLYSLGVVFYEMLTGELPLGRFPTPSQRVKVDVSLDEVVLKTLQHDPNLRFQRASEIKQALTAPVTASPAAVPATQAPDAIRPHITGFAWWSLAFAVASLLVLWEMTRAWFVDAGELERSFFTSEPYTVLLRPLSIASVVLAWVFGWLALRQARRGQGRLRGQWLAIPAMISPVVLLAVLPLAQVLPKTLRMWAGHDLIILAFIPLVAAVFLGLRGAFRRLRRYASDPAAAAPVKTMIATVLVTMLVGTATGVFSDAWAEARKQELILRRSFNTGQIDKVTRHLSDSRLWMEYLQHHRALETNWFGDEMLYNLSIDRRFAYTRINGEAVSGWMPPSRHYIYLMSEDRELVDNQEFGSSNDGELWIRDFDFEGDLLKVEYEFPLRGIWKNHRERFDSEMVLEKEERIRTKYGVEPDTRYRAEIPLKELGKSRDKEFWQSAERVR